MTSIVPHIFGPLPGPIPLAYLDDNFKALQNNTTVSIAALRLLTSSGPGSTTVQGYYSPGDGGGGNYYYDATDTTSADNGGTIIVAADNSRWKLSNVFILSPRQFGAKGDGSTFDDTAFTNLIAVANIVYLPPGQFKFQNTFTINGKNGLVIFGAGAAGVSSGTLYPNNSTLVFDSAGSGNDGLVISNFVGLTLTDFVVSMNRGGSGGGKALRIFGGHNLTARNVVANSDAGTAGVGISLGNGNGATSVFTSTLISCKSITSNGGIAFESNVSNTSLNFIGCYAIHGYWSINTLVYSTFSGCAADGVTGDGYVVTNSTGLTLNACGGESNTLGVFNFAGCAAIVLNSPFGTGNNTSGTTNHGDLIHLNSASLGNSEITIISPASVAPNAGTTASIYGTTNTGTVHVINASTSYVIKGFGGDSTWMLNGLSITGDAENIAFTPVLGSGWTNTGGAPTVTGIYNKKGKLITFTITVTPITTVTGGAAAQMTLPWPVSQNTAASVISNTTAFSDAVVTGAKIFLSQSTGSLSQALTISGSVLLT